MRDLVLYVFVCVCVCVCVCVDAVETADESACIEEGGGEEALAQARSDLETALKALEAQLEEAISAEDYDLAGTSVVCGAVPARSLTTLVSSPADELQSTIDEKAKELASL